MSLLLTVLVVLMIGAIAVVAVGGGESMSEAEPDRAPLGLPADRPVSGGDLRALRFGTALRGYRASEVDAVLDRLAAELDAARDRDGGSGPAASAYQVPRPPQT